jgi:solute carrier family 8 (sodium/calcium exchanger)
MFGPTIDENENLIEVGCCEAFVHFLCMPWKLLFAFIPPRRWGGGWLSFIFTFIMIGLISMVLLSVITSMGCVFNIMPCIQAILMVSIGTSLPDYYASKAIAQDKSITYADAAIGSIFGANAINIFIGLGLPWTISSIYYEGYRDEYYFLGFESGADITFCLVMFFVASFLTFMVLYIRRNHFSGELGGNLDGKCFSGIVLFISWALFVVLTVMGCYEVIASRQVFMPASAVIATQTAGVINTNCPRAINVRTEIINNADGTITVSWDEPQQFTVQDEI